MLRGGGGGGGEWIVGEAPSSVYAALIRGFLLKAIRMGKVNCYRLVRKGKAGSLECKYESHPKMWH